MTALSADRPSTDPNDDLFGHAPFAKSLANSICRYPGSDGLVLALFGPWGSGKSTVLSYVRYYLEQRPEAEQPVIVSFNPWWFSGQENLARAFLGQLQAVLPEKSEKLKKLGDLLSDFAEGVGGLIDLTGVTYGAGTWLGKLMSKAKRKPKDVPALKAAINKVLADAHQRILVVIDDIDRLTPEETRQLFTVIKALADFPNVIYLLAFDREVAVEAIKQQTGLPGERYLEKIIQVPFEIPPVDRVALRAAMAKRLDEVLMGTPDGMFDQSYWANVFFDGIDPLIQVPRDIVRFSNTLSVTYPSVAGEVNPVDFIAIEALRVFLPSVYDVVRSNPDQFAGHRSDTYGANDENTRKKFHDAWLSEVPEERRASTMALMQRIFPKLENTIYGADWVVKWRRDQRVCVPALFPTYFRLAVPPGEIRRSEMIALLALVDTPEQLGQALVDAAHEKRPDGVSRVRALLERLMDYVERDIPEHHIPTVINVLLDVGDSLVLPDDERGTFDFGNESRVRRVVYHLLKREEQPQRLNMLRDAFNAGRGIGVQCYLLVALLDEVAKQAQGVSESLMDAVSLEELKAIWIGKVRVARDTLLMNTQFPRLLSAWREWADADDEVRNLCASLTASDDGLLTFLPHFCSHTRSQTMGDWAVRMQPRLNPAWIEKYIDTEETANRLIALEQAGKIPESAKESASQFLKEFEMIKSGRNPDAPFAFDD
jgi:predicted KAP-like P-loop ATPase